MNEKFTVGQRVRIISKCGFPEGVTGTISQPPKVPIISEDFGGNYFREVNTLQGDTLSFWVVFDSPQRDSDDDGPYGEAEILTTYLEAI